MIHQPTLPPRWSPTHGDVVPSLSSVTYFCSLSTRKQTGCRNEPSFLQSYRVEPPRHSELFRRSIQHFYVIFCLKKKTGQRASPFAYEVWAWSRNVLGNVRLPISKAGALKRERLYILLLFMIFVLGKRGRERFLELEIEIYGQTPPSCVVFPGEVRAAFMGMRSRRRCDQPRALRWRVGNITSSTDGQSYFIHKIISGIYCPHAFILLYFLQGSKDPCDLSYVLSLNLCGFEPETPPWYREFLNKLNCRGVVVWSA